MYRGMAWEGQSKRVISPYFKCIISSVLFVPSTAEHVKFRRNLAGPSAKAKYMK
jgi:hypothetical protein